MIIPNTNDELQRAIQSFQAGDLDGAARLLGSVLNQAPCHATALSLLGLVHYRTGDLKTACVVLERAANLAPDKIEPLFNHGIVLLDMDNTAEAERIFLEIIRRRPNLPEAHFNLANALTRQGKLPEALAHYQQATEDKPDYFEAHFNLGMTYKDMHSLPQAAEAFQKAINLRPDSSSAYFYLALVQHNQGLLPAAIDNYQKAIGIAPEYQKAHYNLGIALHAQGRYPEAIEHFQRSLALAPEDTPSLNNLGLTFRENGQPDEAIAMFRRALAIQPDFHEALSSLGTVLLEKDRFEEAKAAYLQAVSIAPDFSEAWYNLGYCYTIQNDPDGAINLYRQAIANNPDLVQAHWNLSLVLLLAGHYEEGFREYLWRWRRKQAVRPSIAKPEWGGEAIPGRTLLVHTEQGLGDSMQFVRYLRLVKPRVGKLYLACQESLIELFQAVAGVDAVIPLQSIPNFVQAIDFEIPLLNLPTIFTTSVETIPGPAPYLFADQRRLDAYKPLLAAGGDDRLKVGFVWRGNPAHRNDKQRSCRLKDFLPLFDVAGCTFFSLQKGGKEELSAIPLVIDLAPRLSSFADTAAWIAMLDLVISVDTAVVHLAGAMGKAVWTLLPSVPDWRWRASGEHTPWYPTMRLFRRPRRGGWDTVFDSVREELKKTANHKRAGA